MYSGVGVLFIAAAALFYFSKKVPAGIKVEKTEKANKALYSLLIISGLLIIMFVPVFNSYKSDDAKKIEEISTSIAPVNKQIDSLDNLTLKLAASEIVIAENRIAELKQTIKPQTDEIGTIKAPLETYRMSWFFGALAVVVFGLLVSKYSAKKQEGWGAMKYPQLVLGMLAIFVYVGVEVAIGSNLSELLKQKAFGGFQSSEAAPLYFHVLGKFNDWQMGRCIICFNFQSQTKIMLQLIVPLIAFAVIIGVNTLLKI